MQFNISILDLANRHYGHPSENMKMIEELGEFIAASSKWWGSRGSNLDAWKNHLEEFADVLVVCEGLKLRLSQPEFEYVQKQIDFKIDRLAKRMAKANNEQIQV